MIEKLISIGYADDRCIRKIDLAQSHSIIIAGGSESMRESLAYRIYCELGDEDVEADFISENFIFENLVTVIESYAKEIDDRLAGLSQNCKEKVLILNDFALWAIGSGNEGRALALRVRKSVEHIAMKGKLVGIYVILVVGRPCIDVLTNKLKKYIPTRICFKTLTGVDSFAVIGLRKACEIESNQVLLCNEYECEVLNVLPCSTD